MLHVHRAERADRLVDALAGVLVSPLSDPFAPEVVAVPTRGIERWLAQTLAATLGARRPSGDGVCANIDFPPPGALLGGAVAAAGGIDRASDPWLPERAVWPLLAAVEECLGEPWLGALSAHLGLEGVEAVTPDDPRRDRRFPALRHLAGLFDRYGVHRPGMVRAWAAGEDALTDGAPLPTDSAWQAELWRRLRARIGVPSPAERLPDACDALRSRPDLLELPRRLSLFGLTRIPASHLDVLDALAEHRDVHLYLLHPSPVLWAGIAASGEAKGTIRRAEDLTAGTPANPLLGTWGRDARELQVVLSGGEGAAGRRLAEAIEHHHALEADPASLLGRLQAHVRADISAAAIPAEDRPVLDPADRSVQVHACHGRARQVEVLRDAVLHLLAADETLEPRDVIVLCPDIEAFAPLIHASFGAGDAGGTGTGASGAGASDTDLRVRLADRSLRQTNPVLAAVSHLLELAAGRVTASDVLDLADRGPVRRRFDLDDEELARIEDWVGGSGIRWGLDLRHRARWGIDLPDGTWRRGLDRVLVGVTAAEDAHGVVAGVLPLDDVSSGDIDLAGRFAELVDRLDDVLADLSMPQSIRGWAAALTRAADALLATAERDSWQRAQLQRILDDLVGEAGDGPVPDLTPAELRALLADRLRGRATRAGFRTGSLTVCTLMPMRSVPHRVICLLGLDDGVFPRRIAPDGDDLLGRHPHVGDHDPRSEDRQLLLDALLAAGSHLVITYAGRDERTNALLPPAVPVGELLDVVDATARSADGRRARDQVVTAHPLQPFDPRNFAAGDHALVGDAPWSFDSTALAGAQALTDERGDVPAFLPDPLPAPADDIVELEGLVGFVQHPAKAFLRRRLGIVLADDGAEVDDALPIELSPLQEWALGQRLLEARLAGAQPAALRAAELARGTLPPGTLAHPVIDRVGPLVDRLAATADALLDADDAALADRRSVHASGEPALAALADRRSVHIHLALPDGRVLAGTVPDVHGDLLRAVTYSNLAATHRLAAWVRLLALTAAFPQQAWRAATVGLSTRTGRSIAVAAVPCLAGDPETRRQSALGQLGVVLDLHDRGMCEPLPLAGRSSAAWAVARTAGRDPLPPARAAWESTWAHPGEDVELEHRLVLGGVVPLTALLEEVPAPDESGEGWAEDEPTRFGRYARRLWSGLLACEQVEDR